MRLPVGYSNFRELIDHQFDFVDKTLLIKDVIDDLSKVIIITRPRRFGKTLNLSMLHHFFASEAYGIATNGLFDGLKISEAGESYTKQQGQYPVIFISFKDIKERSFDLAYEALCEQIRCVYGEHRYLLNSEKLGFDQKKYFENILTKQATKIEFQVSIRNLCECLFRHHGKKVWVLIDEYDTPIQSAYVHHYFEEMVSFMRGMLCVTLKDNSYLHRSVITGILRIAKENLFSGLNNLEVYTLLSERYAEYFGFTELEVQKLMQQANMLSALPEIREWYNGYQAGNVVLYNPWSIVNYFKNKDFGSYWVNTSDNELIRDLIINSTAEFKEQFTLLLEGKEIKHQIEEHMVFTDLKSNIKAAWSLLFSAGYLKVVAQEKLGAGIMCSLRIPNLEVFGLYQQILTTWLGKGHGMEWYQAFLNRLLTGDMPAFERDLQYIMQETISVHDVSHDPEVFYHGFILGLTASLYNHKNYQLFSNRESGYGRYDYLIFSQDKSKPTILLEFKRVDANKNLEQLEINLGKAAEAALNQINQLNYLAMAKQKGCRDILKIALAFQGKHFKLCYERNQEKELCIEEQSAVYGVNPHAVIADGVDTREFHGVVVRKGTIKAAIENAKILESLQATAEEKQAAKAMLVELAPHIAALELNNHVKWMNPEIQAIFDSHL